MRSTYSTLISTDQLFEHLEDPDWIIFDCRFDLAKPDWGIRDYQKGHIPGAIYAHLNDELSAPIQNHTGRHPLPKPEHWVETLSNWGVNPSKQVVIYDTQGGSFAARMWWMMGWIGHTRAAVLDGGFSAWVREGYPQTAGIETGNPSSFLGHPDRKMVVTADEVEHLRENPGYILIDARSPARYRGDEEPIDAIAGHIPGAVNRFHGDNLGPDGKFLPPDQLHEQFSQLLHGIPPQNAVVYCGSGVTSCHHLLAMQVAGLSGARLYAGSWSEWIRNPERPIASNHPNSTDAGIIGSD